MQHNKIVYDHSILYHTTRSDLLLQSLKKSGFTERKKVTIFETFWCNNYSDSEFMTDLVNPAMGQEEISVLKNTGEFYFNARSWYHVILRSIDNGIKQISFFVSDQRDCKSPEIEYCYEIDDELFYKLYDFCSTNTMLFYDHTMQIRKFAALGGMHCNLFEIDTLHDEYTELTSRAKTISDADSRYSDLLQKIDLTGMKETTKDFFSMFIENNRQSLHRKKLFQYNIEQLERLKNKITDPRNQKE